MDEPTFQRSLRGGPPADQCALIRYGIRAVSQCTGVSAPSSPASTTLTSAFAVPARG